MTTSIPVITGRNVRAWGNVKGGRHRACTPAFADEVPAAIGTLRRETGSVLAHGLGRSYGDSCLNVGGGLIDMANLDRVAAFDVDSGIIRADAGLSLDALHRLTVPRGWFVPVTPGTRFVTLGGAAANDVHGKNHQHAGSFGNHVRRLALRRSDGQVIECGLDRETDLFRATVGGLGLTGLIEWVEFALLPVASSDMEVESIRFDRLDGFFELSDASMDWTYTVAWIDCRGGGGDIGRGIFTRGRHAPCGPLTPAPPAAPRSWPVTLPWSLVNGPSVKAFNSLYYHRPGACFRGHSHFQAFFYPLDGVLHWNRIYGHGGFHQYQCLIPPETARAGLSGLLARIAAAGQGSFLAVLKTFGDIPPTGLLSFARAGTTLALDFPNRGPETHRLLSSLDEVVLAAGGALYPAKDARMPPSMFRAGFPGWREFQAFRDPAFNSDFWRRVAADY